MPKFVIEREVPGAGGIECAAAESPFANILQRAAQTWI